MNYAPKETDDSRADSDDRRDRRGRRRRGEEGFVLRVPALPEGGSPLDGDADRLLRLRHGVQADQDQDHCGHNRGRGGTHMSDINDF